MPHFAIIGGGSIGMRHARNLLTLGQSVRVIEPVPAQAERLRGEGFQVFEALDSAFASEVEAVLICSPTIAHRDHTRAVLEAGKPAFIEKPISHTWEGVEDLLRLADSAGVVTLVGFNMRFRDGFKRAQGFLESGRIGRPLAARAHISYYLPHYHPNADYRGRYQARRALGGGVVLDDIHEIDYLGVLFGAVREVFAYVERLSALDIDVEDYVAATFKHQSGVITQLQMDFLSRVYRRGLEITGTEGVLTLDHNSGEIRIYGPEDGHYEVHPQKMNVSVNDMYLEEMRHFLACLRGESAPIADIHAGARALQVALALFESAEKSGIITLQEGSI